MPGVAACRSSHAMSGLRGATRRCSTMSTSRFPPTSARSSSDPTARARARYCACCTACSGQPQEKCCGAAPRRIRQGRRWSFSARSCSGALRPGTSAMHSRFPESVARKPNAVSTKHSERWDCVICADAPLAHCPVESSSGSRSRARGRSRPRCCFSTSRPPVSIPRPRGPWKTSSAHNLAQAKRLADSIVFLHGGRVTEHTPAEKFFRAPRSREAQTLLEGERL